MYIDRIFLDNFFQFNIELMFNVILNLRIKLGELVYIYVYINIIFYYAINNDCSLVHFIGC